MTGLVRDSALALLRHRFPRCAAIAIGVQGPSLAATIAMESGEEHVIGLGVSETASPAETLEAFARLEACLSALSQPRGRPVLQRAPVGHTEANVISFPGAAAPHRPAIDVEETCASLAQKFALVTKLFGELREEGLASPEVLLSIANRTAALATQAVDFAAQHGTAPRQLEALRDAP